MSHPSELPVKGNLFSSLWLWYLAEWVYFTLFNSLLFCTMPHHALPCCAAPLHPIQSFVFPSSLYICVPVSCDFYYNCCIVEFGVPPTLLWLFRVIRKSLMIPGLEQSRSRWTFSKDQHLSITDLLRLQMSWSLCDLQPFLVPFCHSR